LNNLIIFNGINYQLPLLLGMFGRNEIIYESIYDEGVYKSQNLQIYSCKRLNSKIYIYKDLNDFIKTPSTEFDKFDNKIIVLDELSNVVLNQKVKEITNLKSIFVWYFGELFEPSNISRIRNMNLDYILAGSNRPELSELSKFNLDLLLPFRYFRYYIGYVYLEELVSNIPIPKYDINKPKLFSYVRYRSGSQWRNEILQSIDGMDVLLNPKNSANDSYDLVYPKYKHFEAINDYLYCNFNLIFETIDYRNTTEFFLTEKTFKGLFFGKPFLLVAPFPVLNFLKSKGFSIVNFEFIDSIESSQDVVDSVKLFVNWLNSENEYVIEDKYNKLLDSSKKNRDILMKYLNNYECNFDIFSNLLK
jgi:hypothetical protein